MKQKETTNYLSTRIFAPAVAAIVIALVSGLTAAQELSPRNKLNRLVQQQSADDAAGLMFKGGRDLIGDEQWAKAEQKFDQYISAYPKERNVDAAMYWKAYSEYKLKRFDKTKDTIDKLLKTYDKTTWKEDAEMLLAQLPGAAIKVKVDPVTVEVDPVDVSVQVQDIQERVQERVQAAQERAQETQERAQARVKEAQDRMQERLKEAQDRMKDMTWVDVGIGKGYGFGIGSEGAGDDDPCEFKIVVLQALFQNDVQRGIAVATDWLKTGSAETVTCKRAALSLLARYGGKAVTPTILGVAEHDTDLKLRTRAISVLGSTNDDSVIDPLRDFALNSTQSDISEAALFALSQHTGTRAMTVLAEIATSNKPVALRKMAISSISNRSGEPPVDALLRIYDSDQNLEIRRAAISGLSHRRSERAGAKLLEIARGADNLELRKAAISGIARRSGNQAIDPLLSLYDSEKNEELKDQIISSLPYGNDPRVTHKLIEIARNPQTPIRRRVRAIEILSRNKDPEVQKLLEDLLKQ